MNRPSLLQAARAGTSMRRLMPWAVLTLWAGTEATGATMLTGFVRRGGLHDERLAPSYPATLFANFSIGTAGISLWALYLATRIRALAWVACGQFVVTNAIGTALAVPWHRAEHGGQPTPRGGGRPAFLYRHRVEATHAVLAWSTAALAGAVAATRSDRTP